METIISIHIQQGGHALDVLKLELKGGMCKMTIGKGISVCGIWGSVAVIIIFAEGAAIFAPVIILFAVIATACS